VSRKSKIIILDTSAFIAGFDPFAVEEDLYSVPAVGEELTRNSLPKLRFDAAADRGRLRVQHPNSHYMRLAEQSSKEIGDLLFLSEADMQILALAAQLKDDGHSPTIVTDDYSIQNVARRIDVDFAPLLTFGIRFYQRWLLYCPACRRKYPSDHRSDRCEICGTRLKRRPLSKRPIAKDAKKRQTTRTPV